MKLSELIKNLTESRNSFKDDPEVFIQTPEMEEVEIFDFIQRCSSEREDIYFVINTCDEEAYYKRKSKEWEDEWNAMSKYEKFMYKLTSKLDYRWSMFKMDIAILYDNFIHWCKNRKNKNK